MSNSNYTFFTVIKHAGNIWINHSSNQVNSPEVEPRHSSWKRRGNYEKKECGYWRWLHLFILLLNMQGMHAAHAWQPAHMHAHSSRGGTPLLGLKFSIYDWQVKIISASCLQVCQAGAAPLNNRRIEGRGILRWNVPDFGNKNNVL